MKPQSFEHQLRHAVPPAPDTEAQARARHAALAEFARIHGAQNEAAAATRPAPDTQPARKKEVRWPWTRRSREAWLGGFATACLLLVGVSIVWLLPPRDREINLNVPMSRQEPAPSPERAAPQQQAGQPLQPSEVTQPKAEVSPTTAPEEPAKDSRKSSVDSTTVEERGASTVLAPRGQQPPKEKQAARVARAEPTQPTQPTQVTQPQEAEAQTQSQPRAQAPAQSQPQTQAQPQAQDASNVASGTTTTFGASAGTATTEVTVNGSSVAQLPAPTPITATTDVTDKPAPASAGAGRRATTAGTVPSDNDSLSEVVVTGASRRSRLRDFFSRRSSASEAPSTPPPPSAPPASAGAVQRDEGRDKFQHFETNPVKRVADDPVSTFSVDVDTAAYSFVRRKLNEGVLPQVDSVRVEEMINYFDYNWPVSESREQPFKPTVTVSDSPWGEGKKLIHIGIKGYALPARQQPDVNLVLLLDVSGSMDSPDKLPLAQRSMAMLVDMLKPTDTVAIVVYAGAAGQVLAPTPVSDKQTILQALYSLRPGGSTAGAQGIELAYRLAEKSFRKGGVNRILLATDGDFNVGITNENELKGFVEREREKGVYLSVLGFGEGNYRDQMAQTLAQNGNGVAAYIDTANEAKKVLVQEATSALFPIAKDVKLQVEFNPSTVAEYRLVGYETRALNREDFNNDKVDAGDVGSGHTVTAIYEITPVGSQARLIDERRYAGRDEKVDSQRKANEYGFLKIRYKLPDGLRSRLIEQPILMDAGVPAALKDDVQFSTAVAGFAQLLRGSTYTGKLSYEDVLTEAQHAVGADPFGYRSEFVQLVSKAQRAR